jgi:hypothetical protein
MLARRTPARRRMLAVVVSSAMALAAVFVMSSAAHPAQAAGGNVTIQVLSNRADLVSGGDALVRVTLPAGARTSDAEIHVNSKHTTALRADGPSSLTGLVTGLRVGSNEITAALFDGRAARLVITNHPSGGPVFAGPQLHPWICDNASGGNGPPTDAQCTTKPSYQLMYQAAPESFQPYDPASPPAVVPTTRTDQGKTVPYIIRVERGTMDRGNYEGAVLWDVKTNRPTAWNHKLLVPFGASTAVHYGSGAATSVTDDVDPAALAFPYSTLALARGFLVADNSLNIHGQNANDVVSAEAVMMLKERIVEQYGAIRYTIGNGCSGGAIQQYMLTSMYPGLLDGIQPNCSFSDVFTTAPDVLDCHLLLNYFDNTSPSMWPVETQRAAVDGHRDSTDCAAWDATFSGALDPKKASNCNLPQAQVYDPSTNPTGIRCTIPDYMVSVFGRRPATTWTAVEKKIKRGFAQIPLDTVGVQYGLKALADGTISAAQFADLNNKLGAITIDDVLTPQRLTGDAGAIATLYRTGQVSDPRQWANVPIIDLRGYSESTEIHTSFYTYASRARLDKTNGNHDNQIVWTFSPAVPIGPVPTRGLAEKAFLLMDRWLTRVEADHRNVPQAQKVRQDKPSDATDACFTAEQEQPASTCGALYPPYATPRVAAGGPLANDVVKCALKPLRKADYKVTFTKAEWTQLQKAFPTGVCDYSKPGVSQARSVPWQTYARGSGGQALGAAPVSMPFHGDIAAAPTSLGSTTQSLPTTGGSALLSGLAALALFAAAVVRRARRSGAQT